MRLKSHSYKSKQFFFALLKLCIVLMAFYSIWTKLMQSSEFDTSQILASLIPSTTACFKLVGVLLLLSSLNWLFEILKWQTLASTVRPTSFQQAFKESFGSLTASIITPNRIGEYGAKAICYASHNRMKIVFLNFLGNMTQLSATLLFGTFGLYHLQALLEWSIPAIPLSYLVVVAVGFTLLAALIFKGRQLSVKGYSLARLLNFIQTFTLKKFILVQVYSVVRYLVFSFQMVWLFQFFSIDLNYLELMAIVSSMYLLSSILPSLVVFDVIVKGSIAVFLFGYFGVPETTTLSVILLMWIFNMVVPSVVGSYFVINFKLRPAVV